MESGPPQHPKGHVGEVTLAECSGEEAALVLEQIRDDYLTSQVFFELSRDVSREGSVPSGLHRIAIADILRHTRLGDGEHLATCLDRINAAFQAVRGDQTAMLFAFDQMGGIYIHDATWRSSKALWNALVTTRLPNASELPGMAMPAGPTVPVEAHQSV